MILTLDDFFGPLGVVTIELFPSDQRALGNTRGAQAPIARGDAIWSGEATVRPALHVDSGLIEARIMELIEADGSFLVSPPHASVNGATGSLLTVGADRREVALNGISPSEGEFIGFRQNNVHSLHRVSRVFDGIERISPPLPRSITNGAVATTADPTMHAVAAEGTRAGSHRLKISDGFAFSFIQTLRPAV